MSTILQICEFYHSRTMATMSPYNGNFSAPLQSYETTVVYIATVVYIMLNETSLCWAWFCVHVCVYAHMYAHIHTLYYSVCPSSRTSQGIYCPWISSLSLFSFCQIIWTTPFPSLLPFAFSWETFYSHTLLSGFLLLSIPTGFVSVLSYPHHPCNSNLPLWVGF